MTIDSIPAAPHVAQFIAHLLVAFHNILDVDALSAGVWYIAIDLQLFALLVIVLWIARAAWAGASPWGHGAGGGLAVASLFWFNRDARLPGYLGGLFLRRLWPGHASVHGVSNPGRSPMALVLLASGGRGRRWWWTSGCALRWHTGHGAAAGRFAAWDWLEPLAPAAVCQVSGPISARFPIRSSWSTFRSAWSSTRRSRIWRPASLAQRAGHGGRLGRRATWPGRCSIDTWNRSISSGRCCARRSGRRARSQSLPRPDPGLSRSQL